MSEASLLGLVTVMTMGSRLARSSALGSWLRATGAKHVARLARSSLRGRESSRTSISTMAHIMSDKINPFLAAGRTLDRLVTAGSIGDEVARMLLGGPDNKAEMEKRWLCSAVLLSDDKMYVVPAEGGLQYDNEAPKMEPGRGYYHVRIAPNRFRQGVVSGATLPSACLSPKRTFGREAPLVSVAKRTTPGVYQHPLPY